MAERRMFSKAIIDSDIFLDMPLTTQCLYFHLGLRADDDGFLNNSQKIMRMIGASKIDYDLLVVKNFIIQFDDGICAIKHWKVHNYIRSDRYKPTLYKNQLKDLIVSDNKSYIVSDKIYEKAVVIEENVNNGIPVADQSETQDRLGKIKLDKVKLSNDKLDKVKLSNDKLDKVKISKLKLKSDRLRKFRGDKINKFSPLTKAESSTKMQLTEIIDKWNCLDFAKIVSIKNNRLKLLNSRINEFGVSRVLEAIDNINKSSFLKGQNERGWTITFDWFIKPNNFSKVLEGNYEDKDIGAIKNNNVQYKYSYKGKKTPNKYNNFEPREYDYDSLEEKLLGWS